MSIEDGETSLTDRPSGSADIEMLFREIKVLRASNEILTSGLCGVLMALDSVFSEKNLRLTGSTRNQMKNWIQMAQGKLGPHVVFKQMESRLRKGIPGNGVAFGLSIPSDSKI